MSYLPDSLWSLYPCISVCAFEGANISSNLYTLTLAGKVLLLSVPQASGITSRIIIILGWNQFWVCCRVCSEVHGWQACEQELRFTWILSGLWVDRNASSILFSSIALGQMFTSGSTIGSSLSGPIARCVDGYVSHQVSGRASIWSLDGSLGGQDWLCTVAERIHARDILFDHLADFIPIFLFLWEIIVIISWKSWKE